MHRQPKVAETAKKADPSHLLTGHRLTTTLFKNQIVLVASI